jgi:hypothetical protein
MSQIWQKYSTVESLESLRGQDIKNLLIQHLNVDPSYVARILDREELRILAYEKLIEKKNSFYSDIWWNNSLMVLKIVFIATILFLFRHQILNQVLHYSYSISHRVNTVKIALKHSLVLPSLLLLFGIFLEILNDFIKLKTLLSWIIPKEIQSHIDVLPIPFVPINSETFFPNKKVYNSILSPNQSIQIDVGPIIMTYIIQFIQKRIENLANTIILYKLRNTS